MDPRVIKFLDTARTKNLKDVLSMLNARTGGNKAELKLRVEEYLKNMPTEEALEFLPVDYLEDKEVTGKDNEDIPETSRNDLFKDKGVHEESCDEEESQICSDDDQNMDKEIERLEEKINKKKKIAELRKQLSEISCEDLISTRTCDVTFRDVEESLYKFSGDDHFTIERWITQFEEACEIYGWNQSAKFIYAKRLMYGTAKLFLRAVSVKNWPHLKYLLIKEFKKSSSKAEIHAMLRNRKKRQNETYQQYVLSMQEIGTLAGIDENDVMHYIIEGIPDTNANKTLLYTVDNLTDLKNVLKKYEKLKIKSDSGSSYSNNGCAQKFKGAGNYKNNKQQIKCYNCNEMGHLSNMCTKEKRGSGACFRCKKTGHHIKDCVQTSNSVNNLLTTASKDVHHTYSEVNDFEYFVDFNFFSDTYPQQNKIKLLTLIDSGSPISFVQKRFVTPICIERMDPNQHKYYGINNSPLRVIGKTKSSICFNNEIVNCVLFVVEDFTMYYNVILGRDFLRGSKMVIVSCDKINKNDDKLDDPVQQQQGTCEKGNENLKENTNDETSDDFVSEILNINIDVDKELSTIITNPNLPVETKTNIEKLVSDAFSHDDSIRIGNKDHIKFSIQLTKTDPFYCTPRRLPYSHKEELRKIIDDLLQRGIIRESSSPYASPIVLVKKKNKELRLCVDYRELNKYTVKNNYPLELIDDILDSLREKKYYTVLDMKNGFYHVDVEEDSIKYTAFVTPIGQYEFLKMPFGLKNAPNVFQAFVNRIFKDLIKQRKVLIYIDDLMIATETIDEHMRILHSVLTLVKGNNLQLRLDKCKFLFEEITYLGYVVDVNGIRPNPGNLKAISNYPVPQNVKHVHSFVGLCSYFRRFIKDFATIAKPLHDLLKKDAVFKFNSKELESFGALKSKLLKAPALCVYSPFNETELHCDASSIGYGAILLQKQSDNKFHPIFYFSKRCTDVETRYHSYELETLSIVYALRRFRVYLLGVEFKIITDCRSLTLTLSKKLLNPRISRWALEMQEFDYKIEHRDSSRMQHVDCLSRCTNILLIEDDTLECALAVAQKRDCVIQEIASEIEKGENKMFTLVNGLVYRKLGDEVRFYVPSQLENQVIQVHHESLCHLGTNKCYEYIKESYWFPNMKSKIKDHISNCLKCIHFSMPSGKTEGVLYSIPKGEVPFDTLHVDHLGPLPCTRNKKKYILVVIDGFTKFVKLYAVNSTTSSETIQCLKSYFNTYSRPARMVSDRGSCFTSEEFSGFAKDNSISHIKVATMSPQSNGQVERINRVITPMLAKGCESDSMGGWYKLLPKVEYAINNTISQSTGQTPSRLLFGVDQRGECCDKIMEAIERNKACSISRNLEKLRGKASAKIKENQDYNKKLYDRRHKKPRKYKLGDYVMIKNIDATPGVNKKFLPKYRGPYEVVQVYDHDRYKIQDIDGMQIGRTPYKGVASHVNMKPYMTMPAAAEHD